MTGAVVMITIITIITLRGWTRSSGEVYDAAPIFSATRDAFDPRSPGNNEDRASQSKSNDDVFVVLGWSLLSRRSLYCVSDSKSCMINTCGVHNARIRLRPRISNGRGAECTEGCRARRTS